MLLVLGVLLLQARLLAPCMLLKTTGSFTAALKYTIPTYKSFDECAQACYNDLDCIYVAYGNGSQIPTDTSCNIYMRGGVVFPAHPKVYGINRAEKSTSSAVCSSVVRCAANQNYTKVNATDKLTIEEQQCPFNASIVTVNVYKDPTYGFHAYAMNGTDPIPGYKKICR
ncbi:PAN-like domain protein [Cooperia oncophora]